MTVLKNPVKARCTRCPHMGSTRNPAHYTCGACYNIMSAAGNRQQAKKLRERSTKLVAQAKRFEKQARAFRAKHPGSGCTLPPDEKVPPKSRMWGEKRA